MMRTSLSLGFVILGGVLVYIGYGKTQSFVGGMSRTFSGGYSAETMIYLIGGGVLLMTGLVMLLGKKKKKR